jgi:hypothetical protein
MYTYADPDVVELTDEERARAQKLADRAQQIIAREEVNGVILDTWRRGKEHGIESNISGKAVDACLAEQKANIAELQGITGEMRRMLPADVQAELREEDAQWERKRAEDAETKRIVAEVTRNLVAHKGLLEDIRVDPHYKRTAENVVRFAVRRLRPTHPTPIKIKFFHRSDGEKLGYFNPRDPDTIHLGHGLDDYTLCSVAVHECHHALYPEDSEAAAQDTEDRLAREYTDTHGRRVNGWWMSCA